MIQYPVRIADHVLDLKLREIINAVNGLDQNVSSVDSKIQTAIKQTQTPTFLPSAGIHVATNPVTQTIYLTNTGLTSIIAGSGISVSGSTGDVTITNTGVLSAIGTSNQVNVSAATGNVTFSLPQSIATTSTPQFARMGLGAAADSNVPLLISGSGSSSTTVGAVNLNDTAGNSNSRNWQIGNAQGPFGALVFKQSAAAGGDPVSGNIRMLIDVSGHVGIGTSGAPATSALVELSSTTGALLLSRMTTTQRDALTAVNGMIVYNSTTDKFQGYEAGVWNNFSIL